LPWADATFDYCVSMHGLMMLPEPDLVPALVELRRVTKPGGWLRVSVPDMDQAIYAYLHGNRGWFPLEAPNAGVAFCRYVTQNGATRSVFTQPRLAHLLADAGWRQWVPSACHLSSSGIPGITELDSRPDESIFMEARKP
jgi:predicted SAM-dependent methyltransferase